MTGGPRPCSLAPVRLCGSDPTGASESPFLVGLWESLRAFCQSVLSIFGPNMVAGQPFLPGWRVFSVSMVQRATVDMVGWSHGTQSQTNSFYYTHPRRSSSVWDTIHPLAVWIWGNSDALSQRCHSSCDYGYRRRSGGIARVTACADT
jgi:hypothetical protein